MRGFVAVCALALAFHASCKGSANDRAKQRIFGRDAPTAEIARHAAEQLDPYGLADKRALADRVLGMPFEEVRARAELFCLESTASFEVARGARRLSVVEHATIEQGLAGAFHLRQDNGSEPTREMYLLNDVLFVRAFGGQLRAQGAVDQVHVDAREEVWSTLKAYLGYYGHRLGLHKQLRTTRAGRGAARYTLSVLNAGSGKETVDQPDGPKLPRELGGEVLVDEALVIPLLVSLRGKVEMPIPRAGAGARSGTGTETGAGLLTISLELSIADIGVDQRIKVPSYVSTLRSRVTEVDPLGFLDGGTRTATVVRGRGASAPSPMPSTEPPPDFEMPGEEDEE